MNVIGIVNVTYAISNCPGRYLGVRNNKTGRKNFHLLRINIRYAPENKIKDMHKEFEDCAHISETMQETLAVIGGKWKMVLITILLLKGNRQFRQLSRESGVSPRILSKELSELEANKLISRQVKETRPVTVEYAATAYCESLRDVIIVVSNWGFQHRDVIAGRLQPGNRE